MNYALLCTRHSFLASYLRMRMYYCVRPVLYKCTDSTQGSGSYACNVRVTEFVLPNSRLVPGPLLVYTVTVGCSHHHFFFCFLNIQLVFLQYYLYKYAKLPAKSPVLYIHCRESGFFLISRNVLISVACTQINWLTIKVEIKDFC